MNITPLEIDTFAKEATVHYLTEKIPLSQTIAKLAQKHGMNREQINRVVEGTNANTYTTLFNQADDRYINFEHADSNEVMSSLSIPTKTAEASDDYEEVPMHTTHTTLEKTAQAPQSEITETPINFYKLYTKLAAASSKCIEELNLLEQTFQTESKLLKEQIKTAVIQGTKFGDLYKAATTTIPCPLLDVTLHNINSELKAELPLSLQSTLTKESQEHRRINTDHPFIKQAERVCKCATELHKILTKQEELATEWDDMQKQASTTGEVVDKVLKNLRKPIEHPGLSLTMLGTGAVVTAAGMTAAKHNKEMVENSPLNTIPQHYQR